jgi:AcrR family transcriptional regulator
MIVGDRPVACATMRSDLHRLSLRTKENALPHVPTEDRRRQLIDAAVRVISREGPARATTRRIVAEADASLATLHYSFRNKQELFEAVIDHCRELTVERFREQHRPGEGLASAVYSLLEEFADWARDGVDFHIAQYELFFWALRTDSARAFAPALYKGYLAVFEELLAGSLTEGEDQECLPQLARDVMAVADGMVLQMLALGDEGPSKDDVRRYAELALSGTAPRIGALSASTSG